MTGGYLILGSSGRLAGFLRRAWAVAPPSRPVVWASRRPGAGELRLDPLAEPEALAAAVRASAAVLDLSGRIYGSEAELSVNADLARAVLAAAEGQVPVLLPSSASVYGRSGAPGRESDPPAPVIPYGHTKVAMEAAAAGVPRATCLRIGNIAGADQLLRDGSPREILLDRWDDGATPARSYMGPESFAAILTAVLERAGAGLPPVLNVAAPEAAEMGDLLDAAGLGWTPRPAPATAVRLVELDTTLVGQVYPFRGDEGTAATVAAEWQRMFR